MRRNEVPAYFTSSAELAFILMIGVFRPFVSRCDTFAYDYTVRMQLIFDSTRLPKGFRLDDKLGSTPEFHA